MYFIKKIIWPVVSYNDQHGVHWSYWWCKILNVGKYLVWQQEGLHQRNYQLIHVYVAKVNSMNSKTVWWFLVFFVDTCLRAYLTCTVVKFGINMWMCGGSCKLICQIHPIFHTAKSPTVMWVLLLSTKVHRYKDFLACLLVLYVYMFRVI